MAEAAEVSEQNSEVGFVVPFPETDEEVRQAILDFNSDKCCFDVRPAHRMTIVLITPMPALRYVLQAFTERREYMIRVKPYKGEFIQQPKKLPPKWDVFVQPPTAPPAAQEIDFFDTSVVAPCSNCGGTGLVTCHSCYGRGYHAHTHYDSQSRCSHTYTTTCYTCHGRGLVMCSVCEGSGQNIAWSYLVVTWTMETRTFNTQRGELGQDLLDQARFTKTEFYLHSTPAKVKPIKFAPEPKIYEAAKHYVGEAMAQTDWKILSVNQAVVQIPVSEVTFEHQGLEDHFYVYGERRRIYFPNDYPGGGCGACCCLCCPDCCYCSKCCCVVM